MNAKKVFGFLVCSSAFTRSNITSIGLVLLFFLVYILAGGRIESKLPTKSQTNSFGGVDLKKYERNEKQVLGIVPTDDRRKRESARHVTGRIFTDEDASNASKKPIDKDGLIKGESVQYGTPRDRRLMKERERRARQEVDPLDAIMERLR